MIWRLLFALASISILGALLYFQDADNGSGENAGAEPTAVASGYSALHAELIETGPDGQPLYRLDADRIEQPQPQGTVFLTNPKLDYQPEAGNPWTLTAQSGQMPQDARTAWDHPYHTPGARYSLQPADSPNAQYRPVQMRGDLEARDPKTGDLQRTIRLGAPTMLSPIAAGNMLYVVTEKAELIA